MWKDCLLERSAKVLKKTGSFFSGNKDYIACKTNLIISLIRKLRDLELEESGTKKEKNLINFS